MYELIQRIEFSYLLKIDAPKIKEFSFWEEFALAKIKNEGRDPVVRVYETIALVNFNR